MYCGVRSLMVFGVPLLLAVTTAGPVMADLVSTQHRLLVKRGDPVPSNIGSGLTIRNTFTPNINRRGSFVFEAVLRGEGVTSADDRAFLAYRNDRLEAVIRTGTVANGATMPLRNFSGQAIIDDQNRIGFLGTAANSYGIGVPNETGLWAETNNGVSYVIGNAASPDPGVEITSINQFVYSKGGRMAVTGQVDGVGAAIFEGTATSMSLRVVAGQPASGLGGNNVFTGFSTPVLNRQGSMRFRASHPEPEGGMASSGIWADDQPSGVRPILIRDDPTNGYAQGSWSASSNYINTNNREDLAYLGGIYVPTEYGPRYDYGVMVHRGNNIRAAWLHGIPIEIDGEQVNIESTSGLILNRTGEVAAYGVERGVLNQQLTYSVYRGGYNDPFTRVATGGDQAPGLEPGIKFRPFVTNDPNQSSSDLFMNSSGYLIFLAYLQGPGVTDANDEVLYVSTPTGGLSPILREGDLISVSQTPGLPDRRVVSSFSLPQNSDSGSGGEEGRRSPLNDRGELVLDVTFSQGEGIFLFELPGFLQGDIDGDGFVGLSDLDMVLDHWNQSVSTSGISTDLNGDGFVGLDDLDVLLTSWNAGVPPAATTIPEPASYTLFLFSSSVILNRLKRVFN